MVDFERGLRGAILLAAMLPAAVCRGEIDFARDVQPLLAGRCWKCHGPDAAQRQGGLRLDGRDGVLAGGDSGLPAVVPGAASESELLRRIESADGSRRMPPPETGDALSAAEIALLRQWIEQGAPWQRHWAYIPPRRRAIPPVSRNDWPAAPLDYFLLSRMEEAGVAPSPPASRERLIRRATLDLTGLPPTIAEIEEFNADRRPDAYDRLLDRLLASPRFGERMAAFWLDLARYADTHGYHIDSHREMWRWRDWVIDAFNAGQPFDRFTVEQIAGDLLPGATLQQRIASGFNRNHMINFAGGAIPEEFAVEYVADRVETTATVWLGQTVKCARCHDHKFDPITQRDYFRLFAYFNNVAELGLDGRDGNAEPWIEAPTPLQAEKLAAARSDISALAAALTARAGQADNAQRAWEQEWVAAAGGRPPAPRDTAACYPLDSVAGNLAIEEGGGPPGKVSGRASWFAGKFGKALLLDGESWGNLGSSLRLSDERAFTLAAWVFPTTRDRMAVIAQRDDDQPTGWALLIADGRVGLEFSDSGAMLRALGAARLKTSKWQHVMVSYPGFGGTSGIRVYVDGEPQKMASEGTPPTQPVAPRGPLLLGKNGEADYFRGMIDDVRVYQRALDDEEAAAVASGNPERDLALIPPHERTAKQAASLRDYYLRHHDEAYRKLHARLEQAQRREAAIRQQVPTAMVMQELETPRETRMLIRGQYNRPGEPVTPGTPAAFPPLPEGAAPNRLALAKWIVAKENPLTARVVVNHFWQLLFGEGLVRTPEDFGTRGERPTHPELLDRLAVELVESGWDVKSLFRAIMLSSAYRQSSSVRPELAERDRENRLFARMSRWQLPAELVRDQALLAAGLLSGPLGGESVYPYQPEGLWKEVSYNPREYSAQIFVPGSGEELYRRSLYTFWKRAAPQPAMTALGAPSRETCTVRRSRPNTPFVALVLLNDPTYVEAARKLAERMMMEGGPTTPERIAFGFRLIAARPPAAKEAEVLLAIYRAQLEHYGEHPQLAADLAEVGESERNESLDPREQGALAIVAGVILNLDEAITRP